MPRPEPRYVTFSIDGRDVSAPEGMMLVDGAKHGDVEIPVFCYEPKLGAPVGACRMCLVEIEGIPKLQTACSTPVKDGMVVHTQTERVRGAQQSVVEFLLINHPLDCPVCDKGGECPLQDITFGWGAGKSRFIEPKRHFKKPLELSPLIAIDRERCILCYRCVRFSQEVAEDYQLVLLERGAHSYVGTFDGHPYVAPFSGNIIELCPVGALTSRPYRFRARPWEVENAGTVCTLCPAQCNITFTVRDDRVLRVAARDNDQVDDGWLCDKGRFAYQSVHADERILEPLVRDGDELRPASWERALDAAAALGKHKGRVGAVVGGQATNEEGFLLQRLLREGLESPHIDCRASGPPVPLGLARALADPAVAATVPDLEYAHTVLVLDTELVDDAPILDLRVRKGVRRRGVRLITATDRPSSLDPNAHLALRYAPGGAGAFLQALDAALGEHDPAGPEASEDAAGSDSRVAALASAAGAVEEEVRATAELLRTVGEDVVIVWGERLGRAGPDALRALLNLAGRLNLAGADGAGLLEVPSHTNGRGLREAGCLPGVAPGYENAPMGLNTTGIARAAAKGEQVTALYLLHTDPLRSSEHGPTWREALGKAALVVAHASVLTEGLREHADVVFPAEAYPEKDGTLVHPDGRVQRVRQAIGRPGEVRASWQVIADVARRLGLDLGVLTAPMATRQLFDAVPFYAGLTLEALAGHGVRWPESVGAAALPAGERGPFPLTTPEASPSPNGALRLGRYRSIWAAPEVEVSPALKFLAARQIAELSPADAEHLGLTHGQRIRVGSNGSRIDAEVHIRGDAPPGTVFLQEGTAEGGANALDGPLVELEAR